MTDVLMPQLGETVTGGTIIAWLKKVGDRVAVDEPLFEVETEKVSMEIPAAAAGILETVLVDEGETAEVGAKLAIITSASTRSAERAQGKNGSGKAETSNTAAGAATSNAPAASAPPGNAALSPVVRRLLAEHGIDASQVTGTGAGGRITREDVLAHVKREARPEPDAQRAEQRTDPQLQPFTALRKRIAAHMVQSKATSPHVLQAVEADFHRIEHARREAAESWKSREGFSLTYLPFVAYSVCRALERFPLVNATIEGDALRKRSHVNLSIAVDLDFEGLVAPVIKDAGRLPVAELARRIHDLATRARNGGLSPDDMAGGTYTISNSGVFGTLITAPIINQPQVAILSTDGVRKLPRVVEEDGQECIVARPVGVLAQSFDHRAFDGAYSASYLNTVRQLIEETDWQAELRR